jgi:hypothetical protein
VQTVPQSLRALVGGKSRASAVHLFLCSCGQPGTLPINDFWLGPRVTKLLQYLSDPITSEQAEVLTEVALRRVWLDEMIGWLEFGNITWNDYVETHLRPKIKTFKSMLHLWLGKEAIYRNPPLVCRVRVDRIDCDHQHVSVHLRVIESAGFTEPRPLNFKVTGSWEWLSFSEKHWHVIYGNWSLFFGANLIRTVQEYAAALPPNLDVTSRVSAILEFLYKLAD